MALTNDASPLVKQKVGGPREQVSGLRHAVTG